ncbi:MAG: SIMPL domain-containing protein [Acidimicrobiia bacterium]
MRTRTFPRPAAALAAVVTAAVAMVGLVGVAPAGAATRERTITVVGVGKVKGTPDVADLSIGVEAHANTAVEALQTVSDRAQKVIDVLHDAGVDDADIQTNGLTVGPTYDDQNHIDGYQASNSVVARIRDLSKAGQIVDAAAAKAGDNLRVDGITFSIDDDSDLLAQARVKAIKRARAQAGQLADAAGVSVGDVLTIDEQTQYSPLPYYSAADAAGSSASPVSPGTETLSVTATVVFAIG